jgi:hypothetical protein
MLYALLWVGIGLDERATGTRFVKSIVRRAHPPPADGKEVQDRRRELASFLVTMLAGIAYGKTFDAGRPFEVSLESLLLLGSFFLIATRFFIGNLPVLLSGGNGGMAWFYDLLVITVQSSLLIVLAGVSPVAANLGGDMGFVEWMLALYLMDIVWIASKVLPGRGTLSWREADVPWPWFWLNVILSLATFIFDRWIFEGAMYSRGAIIFLFVSNALGFLFDVLVADQIKLFGERR